MRPFLASAFVVFCVTLLGCGGASQPAPTAPSPPAFVITNIDEMLSEKSLGNPNAIITVIDYSSLTCPHCATFHLTTLPQLKRSYIDTGQVRYIYRDFPVNGASTTPVAVSAAALARCAGNEKYFQALDLLYAAQGTWAGSSNPSAAMKQALASLGMPSDKLDACLASTALQEGINRQKSEGQSAHGVTGTPTVLVNGQRVADTSFNGLVAVLQPLTATASATCRSSCHRVD